MVIGYSILAIILSVYAYIAISSVYADYKILRNYHRLSHKSSVLKSLQVFFVDGVLPITIFLFIVYLVIIFIEDLFK